MRYTIRPNDDGTFTLASLDGDVLVAIGAPHATFDDAVAALGGVLTARRLEVAEDTDAGGDDDVATGDGLLPDIWTDGGGIAFTELLPGGRDFTQCVWSWRDPAVSLLPLMYQNQTAWGHDGAELAGFIETLTQSGGTVHATGRFYDNVVGEAARDLLLDGRRFGVSVDPSEDVEVAFQCTEVDDDGWCVDGVDQFLAYEIAGLTMTPFPAFEEAAIILQAPATPAAAPGVAPAQAVDVPVEHVVVVAAAVPTRPPAEWLTLQEPQLGQPFLGTLGDEFLVDQGDGSLACPLTIEDSGQVFGNLARWGQCHVGYPGMCVTPPESAAAYAHFHVGQLVCADGTRIASGALVVGCEHAPEGLDAWQARDHYAHAGNGWADGRMSTGKYGPWFAGALRPGVTEEQLRVLRALTLSGDWRRIGTALELIAALTVNTPGFPIAREAVTASGYAITGATPMPSGRIKNGEQQSLVAAGLVARCADCQKRREQARAAQFRPAEPDKRIDEVLRLTRQLDLRTRHLIPDAAQAARARIR